MCSFKLIYFVIFIVNLIGTKCHISDKRLCVDEHCKEPVSFAKTLQRYSSPDPLRLSFAPNVNITIYSKEAGKETSLWGAELNGKRGYIPKTMARETKVLQRPTKLVDTEVTTPKVPEKIIKENLKPDNVQQSFEVVDGTTLYTGADIVPSSTATPVHSTATPNINKEREIEESNMQNNGNVPMKENSIVSNVIDSISNWANSENEDDDGSDDDDDDDDGGEVHQDEEDDEEDENEDDSEDENEELSSKTKPMSKFKVHSLEINAIEVVGNVTNNENSDEIESQQISSDDPDNNLQQAEVASLGVMKNEQPNEENIKVEETESTTVNPLELEKPPIEEIVTEPTKIKEEPLSVDIPLQTINAEVTNEVNAPEKDIIISSELQEPEEIKNSTSVLDENIDYQQSSFENKQNLEQIVVESVPEQIQTSEEDLSKESLKVENQEQKTEVEATVSEHIPSPPSHFLFGQRETPVEKTIVYANVASNIQDIIDEVVESNIDINDNNKEIETQSNENSNNAEPATTEEPELMSQENYEASNVAESDANTEEEFKPVIQEIKNDEIDININPNIIEDTVPIYQENNEQSQDINKVEETAAVTTGGIFSSVWSLFSSGDKEEELPIQPKQDDHAWSSYQEEIRESKADFCTADNIDCKSKKTDILEEFTIAFNSDFFLYLFTTAISCTIFLFIYLLVDKNRRVSPLIAKINKLEKDLLVSLKENELLQEQSESTAPVIEINTGTISSDIVEELNRQLLDVQLMKENLQLQVLELQNELETKQALEFQVESLEKELETSTEVGMELNRIISEMLNPESGSERLKENVEQLQRQLLEQKDTINNINAALIEKEEENSDLLLEIEAHRKKSHDLQMKIDEVAGKVLIIEKEKDEQQKALQNEISIYQRKYNELALKDDTSNKEIQILRSQLSDTQRQLDLKMKEYQNLKENISNINSLQNNNEALASIFDTVSMKAEYDQLKNDRERYAVELEQVQLDRDAYEKNYQRVVGEMEVLKQKYEQADKEKVEVNMKLEVLNNYFKKREAELQEEVLKFKSIWDAKEGEATSTTERTRLLKEEIENYKSQNETLKQEIISQEIDLKSQISVLEKKVHENWVQARQTERRLEDARQEAAQLRNRLTLRERAIDERAQNRLQSPLEQNGDLNTFSPHPIESPASPPLLYSRDHMTKSPQVPNLPFIPPPPGAPFLPPPPLHGLPPFVPMPPPPLFPGDRRPPPLGRMSSPPPPLNSRYSPDTSAFSPYDRNSPSPPYDSEYGASPPPIRGYSPYRDDRRDYKRLPPPPHIRSNGRNTKGSILSSGSDRSNESLDKINRNQSKMV